jgi:hypothetical protein
MDAASEPWDLEISHVIQADRADKAAAVLLSLSVRRARSAGHSWAAIGCALGIGEGAARERFDSGGGGTDS